MDANSKGHVGDEHLLDLSSLCCQLLDGSPFPMVAVLGSAHIVSYVNPAYCRLVSKSRELLMGNRYVQSVEEEKPCQPRLPRKINGADSDDTEESESSGHKKADSPCTIWPIPSSGNRPAGVMIQMTDTDLTPLQRKRVRDMSERLLVGALVQNEKAEEAQEANLRLHEDIVQRKQVEATIKAELEHLKGISSLAEGASIAKTIYLANTSHELRTPLTAMIGLCELLLEDAEDTHNTSLASDLNKIRSAGRHLQELLGSILDMSKVEAGKMLLNPESFQVDDLLQRVIDQAGLLVKKNSSVLATNFAEGLGVMNSDEMKILQILLNLVSNAAKFTDGGTVTLEAERENTAAGVMIFRVRDTGPGIAPEEIGKLFQPFYQIRKLAGAAPREGTGLGLALSRKFCELLGGTLQVESVLGHGSLFTVRLPVNLMDLIGAVEVAEE